MTAYISKCGYCHETQFTQWYSKRAPHDQYGRVDRDYMDTNPVAFCSEEHRDAADALFDQMVKDLIPDTEQLRARIAEAVATVARLEQKRIELERIANAERARAAELEAPAAVQQRKGYEAAIEVMRQEKLPMSVGLLEAQLELNKLDGLVPQLTVFRASHDSIVMGLYITAAEARKHCEAEERRAWAKSENPTFDWIEDEEDGVAELTAWVGGEEVTTSYVVTALEVASEYDEGADE